MLLKKFQLFLASNTRFISVAVFNTVSLSTFLFLLRAVRAPGKVVETDIVFFIFLKSIRNDVFTHILRFITATANPSTLSLGLLLGSAYFYKTRHWNTLIAFIISVGGGSVFVTITKLLIQRDRPSLIDALVQENTFSFPSGHVFMGICFYGFLAYYFIRSTSRVYVRRCILELTVLLVLGIALSRTYLGAHWLSDVVASMAAGSVWLFSIVQVLELRRKGKL